MAHYAEVIDNVVTRVITINNDIEGEGTDEEKEIRGAAFCQQLLNTDTQWLKTSYNGNYRGIFAGVGTLFNSVTGVFEAETIDES